MRVLLWCGRILIFLFLLAFALKNTDPVSVFFFYDTSWQAPLIIVVLAFFAGGVALGVLGLIGTVFNLRREIKRLKRHGVTPKEVGDELKDDLSDDLHL